MPTLSYSDRMDAEALEEPLRSARRTKKQIKAATARVLAKLGFHAMRVSDICAEAKIAQGTFYIHFKDKDQIVGAVLDEFIDMMLASRVTAVPADNYENIKKVVAWFFESFKANVGLFKALIQLSAERPEFSRTWEKWNKTLVIGVIDGLADRRKSRGAGSDEVLRLSVYIAGGMLDQALYATYAFHRSPDFERLARNEKRFVEVAALLWYRAIFGENPPSKPIKGIFPL